MCASHEHKCEKEWGKLHEEKNGLCASIGRSFVFAQLIKFKYNYIPLYISCS